MRRMTALITAIVAGLALSARAADTNKKANDDAVKMHKGEAKRHIWTSDVALEQAKLGMQGLYALANDDEGAWDKDHAQTLLDNVERSVRLAATHLQHLTTLPAKKDDNATTDLTRAQTSLARVQSALKDLETPVKSGMAPPVTKNDTGMSGMTKSSDKDAGIRGQLKGAWDSLDSAMSDFKKVAGDYKVTTRLPNP